MTTTFGQLLAVGDQERDAIHVATMPVTADCYMRAGDPVSFSRNDTNEYVRKVKREDAIGIVDAFLTVRVRKGDRFHMFLLPNTITALRHKWTHPGVDDRLELLERMVYGDAKIRLRNFAKLLGVSYDDLIAHANYYQLYEEYWSEGSRFEGVHIYPEFWSDWTNANGDKNAVATRDGSFFSCAC